MRVPQIAPAWDAWVFLDAEEACDPATAGWTSAGLKSKGGRYVQAVCTEQMLTARVLGPGFRLPGLFMCKIWWKRTKDSGMDDKSNVKAD